MKIEKMKRDMHTKEELKTVALGTSKINYLDPRITVAWCKRNEVPIEKVRCSLLSLVKKKKKTQNVTLMFVDIHQVSAGEVFMGNGRRTGLQILVICWEVKRRFLSWSKHMVMKALESKGRK